MQPFDLCYIQSRSFLEIFQRNRQTKMNAKYKEFHRYGKFFNMLNVALQQSQCFSLPRYLEYFSGELCWGKATEPIQSPPKRRKT